MLAKNLGKSQRYSISTSKCVSGRILSNSVFKSTSYNGQRYYSMMMKNNLATALKSAGTRSKLMYSITGTR
jgi:hypothetical protein